VPTMATVAKRRGADPFLVHLRTFDSRKAE
jgi:hypothetical protein